MHMYTDKDNAKTIGGNYVSSLYVESDVNSVKVGITNK